jgi:hypothetical protein
MLSLDLDTRAQVARYVTDLQDIVSLRLSHPVWAATDFLFLRERQRDLLRTTRLLKLQDNARFAYILSHTSRGPLTTENVRNLTAHLHRHLPVKGHADLIPVDGTTPFERVRRAVDFFMIPIADVRRFAWVNRNAFSIRDDSDLEEVITLFRYDDIHC